MTGHPENETCGNNKHVVEHILSSIEIDDAEPPPPHFVSPYNTIEEWLFNVCDKEKPAIPIATYSFGLFEGANEYVLCLTGVNSYQLSKEREQIRIDFAPADMYYPLRQSEYKNLNREQVLERLTSELKAFTTTDKFRQSFFSQAESIRTDWNGDIIWSK
jgi:hypothetical protein